MALLHELRWGADTETCPACGTVDKHYFIRVRKQWRCKHCGHTFSLTSGTVFAYRKLPLVKLLYIIALYSEAAKGIAARQLARHAGVERKTAFVWLHKLREAFWRHPDTTLLGGDVEMDGAYFHWYVRPKNKRHHRVDRRLRRNLNPNKRALFVMRQRGLPGEGASHSIVQVIKRENDRDVEWIVRRFVADGSRIFADEHPCYAVLAHYYSVHQVNHQEEYSSDDGINQNQAESFFARIRRMMMGQIHKCAPKYLLYYGWENVWREDKRRLSSWERAEDLIDRCFALGPSRIWAKYWQGNHLLEDTLITAGQ